MIALVSALATFAGVEVDTLAARLKRDAIALAAVAFLLLVAVVFVLVALYAALAMQFGAPVAALLIAGGALVLALIAYLVMLAMNSAAARREAEHRRAQEKAALITALATAALPLALRSGLLRRIGLPLGGVLAAGYLLAKRDGDDPEADGTKS